MIEAALEDHILNYLSKDDSDEPNFQSVTTIMERIRDTFGIELNDALNAGVDDKRRVMAALNRLVTDGMVEVSHTSDFEPSYRVTTDGFYQSVIGPTALVAENEELKRTNIDPVDWTGSRLVYVDSKVLTDIRSTAKKLQALARVTNYASDQDRDDLQGLCNALAGLCDMAVPEIGLIDQITSHPKFQLYASLLVFVATIRGALGI